MKIALGADHRGYKVKDKIIKHLESKGYETEDFGTNSEESVDYTDYAIKVGESVARNKSDRGILVCWTGIGMCIAANKVKGVRAASCLNKEAAQLTKQHNDSNVLCISAKFTPEDQLLEIVDTWIETEFEGGRHLRRVKKITDYEKSSGSITIL
jgi:RpiB/LacA/LacB family sugar-phosphate isomerase